VAQRGGPFRFFIYDPRKAIRAFGQNLPGASCSTEGHRWSRTSTPTPPPKKK